MSRYRLTPAARSDLSPIWDDTEDHSDVRQAEVYVNEIRAAIERVADDPQRGRTCNEIRAGYRRYGIESHILSYVDSADGVSVIRILHQRMDPTRHI